MIRSALLCLFLIHGSVGNAEIYRWVDEDGRITFSDRRIQGAERFNVYSQAEKDGETTTRAIGPASPDEAYPGPYSELEILAPAADETINDASGNVAISLLVNPALIEGQRMALLLNGTEIPIEGAATQFRLNGVTVGTHRVQLQVRGGNGDLVAQTAPRAFHLRPPKLPGQLP